MMGAESTVIVVEDDEKMRDALVLLLQSREHCVQAYASPAELLKHYNPDLPGCLLLDLRLPEMSGLELWQAIRQRGGCHPVIIVSGTGDVSTAVRSIHEGAVDFISKPFDFEYVLNRVDVAVQQDREERQRRLEADSFHKRIESLTRRERQVMEMVADGMLTKQIASKLGISYKTVEVHRSHVTKKMGVRSAVELVRLLAMRRWAELA